VNGSETTSSFMQFQHKFEKSYASQQEFDYRFGVFKQNLEIIDELNKKDSKAGYGVTKFSDLTQDEFRRNFLMDTSLLKDLPTNHADHLLLNLIETPSASLPSAFDWRNKSAITAVKNQDQCGACWAFSATEAIESAWFLAGNNLTTLSPEQIVDCSWDDGNHGCLGGYPIQAYEYVMKYGLESESAYPYMGWEQFECTYNQSGVIATVTNWTSVTTNLNETEMMDVMYQKGPLSICVDAEQWQFYEYGVMSYLCGTSIDHCVQLVGWQNNYNDDGQPVDIWIVRNSWGVDWGYDGYIYIERGNNWCAIAEMVTLPLIQ